MNIGDLIFSLLADGSKLEQSVVKQADKAGAAGAKTLGNRLSAGLKTEGVRVLSGALSLGAAALTRGALEMEDATARVAASTGASMEEAAKIADSANRIAGDQRRSLSEVIDVSIALRKNLGATGEELDRLTEKTVKFARVNGVDAVGSVMKVDGVVDAWGLSLDKVDGLLDRVTVSTQKFGGSVDERLDALNKMAPALQAIGAELEDGEALLNLFEESGLDATKTVAGLNKAVKDLKPGQTLDDLIREIASIEDPTKRAQRAIEVFGVRSGTGLANALKPGRDSLDAFAVSTEEASGAVEEGVDKLDSTLTGRLKKILSQAGAALRGFGQDLGPGVTAAASLATLANALGVKIPLGPFKKLGAKLGGVIASGIGSAIVGQAGAGIVADSVADSVSGAMRGGKLKAATGKLGQFLGSSLGKATAVAFAAFAWIEVVETYNRIKGELAAQSEAISEGTKGVILKGTQADLEAARNGIEAGLQQLNATWDAGLFTTDTRKKLEADLAAVNAELGRRAENFGPTVAEGIEQGGPAVHEALGDVMNRAVAGTEDAIEAARAAGGRFPMAFVNGMRSTREAVFDEIASLRENIKNALSPAAQAARLTGFLTGKMLQRGLHSADPLVRRQADATRAMAEERLAKIIAGSGAAAKKAGEALAKGLKSKNPAIRAAAQRVQAIVDAKLEALEREAAASGTQAGNSLARNLRAAVAASMTLGIQIRARYQGKTDHGRASGGPIRAGVPYLVNEQTPRSEVIVPSAGGYVLTRAQAEAAISGRGGDGPTSITVPVAVQGVLNVRSARDIATEVRRAGELGIPVARSLPNMYPRREVPKV